MKSSQQKEEHEVVYKTVNSKVKHLLHQIEQTIENNQSARKHENIQPVFTRVCRKGVINLFILVQEEAINRCRM